MTGIILYDDLDPADIFSKIMSAHDAALRRTASCRPIFGKTLIMAQLDIGFVQQFKEEGSMLPVIDRHHGNVDIRFFTQSRKERRLLRKFMEKQMDDTPVIHDLIVRLEQEDLAKTRRLIHYMAGLPDALSDDMRKDPYSAAWCSLLTRDVHRLLHLLCADDNAHIVLYNQLNELLIGPVSASLHGQLRRQDIPHLMKSLKASGEVMYGYYDVFMRLMQQQWSVSEKFAAESRQGRRLSQLIRMVGSLIASTKCTYSRLAEWQEQVRQAQRRETYN